MPTLFARRYVRKIEAVGHTEKLVGALILLLVAGIVVVYVGQVASNRDYLFNVAETAPARPTAIGTPNPFPDPRLTGRRAPDSVEHFRATLEPMPR